LNLGIYKIKYFTANLYYLRLLYLYGELGKIFFNEIMRPKFSLIFARHNF